MPKNRIRRCDDDDYQRHGFELAPPEDIKTLLETYWKIPKRQIETSVVLVRERA